MQVCGRAISGSIPSMGRALFLRLEQEAERVRTEKRPDRGIKREREREGVRERQRMRERRVKRERGGAGGRKWPINYTTSARK